MLNEVPTHRGTVRLVGECSIVQGTAVIVTMLIACLFIWSNYV
jgi:hypothetical protein